MIKNLSLKNIKCFDCESFTMAPLTIFCGPNSAGKSTAIQCLLLLRQSFNEDKFNSSEISLTGEYYSIGHVYDLIYHGAQQGMISIAIDDLDFSANLASVNTERYQLPFTALESYTHSLFNEEFVYLSAERLGPRNSYDVRFDSKKFNIGIYGEFAMSEFSKRADSTVENTTLARLACKTSAAAESDSTSDVPLEEMPSETASAPPTLEIAVKTVMRRISPGFDINYSSHKSLDKVSNTYSSDSTKAPVRPSNTGFGISFVFPIIVAAFCIKPESILVIENPEVHLHPQAQSELAQFLGEVSLSGVQVIIETHSDHIINGSRLFAKKYRVDTDHTAINSIRRNSGKHELVLIKIDKDGNLTDLQEGFFDQAQNDLLKLF